MDLNEYVHSLQGKRVAVIGIGVSNTPLIELLLKAGVDVTACDKKDRSAFQSLAEALEQQGAHLQLGPGYLDGLDQDVIFRTPGLRPDVPQLQAARQRGSRITSEMEVFFQVCPCFRIAVTGSDGKTTTTTLISELLKAAGKTVYLGGNIGHPLLCEAEQMDPKGIAVLELSSFQLMTMQDSAEVAVITNLSPNHLDVHKDMDEYVSAKKNVFLHQSSQGTLILNADNAITRGLAAEANGQVRFFSRETEPENGAFLREDMICLAKNGQQREVLNIHDIRIPGVHNIENYMAAILAVEGLVPDEVIRDVAKTFGGVEHRIELVREWHGVRFYNDSIASSPSRTIAGLRSFSQKVILIAGGKDKGVSYDAIGPEIIEHVKKLYLTGPTSAKIRCAVEKSAGYRSKELPIVELEDFRETVLAAAEAAEPGDVVILSPASTSFDRFKNFMERGETFKAIVQSL